MSIAAQECPVCRTPLSETQYAEVQAQIRAEEEIKFEEARQRLQSEFALTLAEQIAAATARIKADAENEIAAVLRQQELLAERTAAAEGRAINAEQQHETMVAALREQHLKEVRERVEHAMLQVRQEADQKLDAAATEHRLLSEQVGKLEADCASMRVKAIETAEALRIDFAVRLQEATSAARAEANAAARDKLKSAADEADQLRQQLEANRAAHVETEADFTRKIQAAAAAARLEADAAARDKLKSAVDEAVQLRQQLETIRAAQVETETIAKQAHDTELQGLKADHQAEIEKQRSLLDQAREADLIKLRGQFANEKDRWQQIVTDLQRKVDDQKTANELGDGPEIDIYQALRDAYVGDDIRRVQKGEPGADVIHKFMYKGDSCGLLVIDSKNRKKWENSYVQKLRQDQLTLKADHAILPTSKFPGGEKDLVIRDGVIICKPRQVVALVAVLRANLLRMHQQGLSARDRARKTDKLYSYIQSDRYQQQMKAAEAASRDLQALQDQEYEEHKKMWAKRGVVMKGLDKCLREVEMEITAILEISERAVSEGSERNIASA